MVSTAGGASRSLRGPNDWGVGDDCGRRPRSHRAHSRSIRSRRDRRLFWALLPAPPRLSTPIVRPSIVDGRGWKANEVSLDRRNLALRPRLIKTTLSALLLPSRPSPHLVELFVDSRVHRSFTRDDRRAQSARHETAAVGAPIRNAMSRRAGL
uniref:Uncharacterized protein n=1 Tax=Plectus sambesii TaxID=2011161 RepID=A0A914WT21_9BILA